MRKSIAYSPTFIGEGMDGSQAELLIYKVRCFRYRGFEPILYLTRDELERLAAFWPCFYLTSKAIVPQDGRFIAWLKRLFRMKVREKLVFYRVSDNALIELEARILKKKAIPIDGVWTDIVIADGAEESTA